METRPDSAVSLMAWRCRAALALIALLATSCAKQPRYELSVELAPDGRVTAIARRTSQESWTPEFEAHGKTNQWPRVLRLFPRRGPLPSMSHASAPELVTEIETKHGPPLFAELAPRGNELVLAPSAPLTQGAGYLLVFDPGEIGLLASDLAISQSPRRAMSGDGFMILAFDIPTDGSNKKLPEVVSVQPTTTALPANALKFYITFSQPMEQGVFLERLALLDATTGQAIEGPFRETELWSPDGRRLTAWIHPGRQKTGVNLNEDEGPVLKPGQRVKLRVSGEWRATNGSALGRDVTREWTVSAADHQQPAPARWKITAPHAGTRAPLEVLLDEPLDAALLLSAISVRSSKNEVVPGTSAVLAGEMRWLFTPDADWSAGTWQLAVGPAIEDLAGNSPERLFETETGAEAATSPAGPILRPFVIE